MRFEGNNEERAEVEEEDEEAEEGDNVEDGP